ncbi:transketolase [Alkalispirochaeta odontotermitis]|nr:transketolase [Alkalispirochaeta odontotermitis]CAB1071322.1 Transketolase, N-terminal section (EC [Olavius algarvensis Delta 1 endosymbiont]
MIPTEKITWKLEENARELRKYILIMNCHAGSGHPGGSLSAAEIITYLFHNEINFSHSNCNHPDRDRFILSKGHSCLALYGVLAQKGFFGVEEFRHLRCVDGMLQGHPDRLKTPGVEFNSGSLGQGFSFALGCALGGKRNKMKYRVYVLLGDGELNEGQVWEGMMFGARHQLDNLVAIVDYNKYQSDDLCSNVTALEPLAEKFKAFGWDVVEIDGHNFLEIGDALNQAKKTKGKPFIIVAHTIKGKGISFMEGNPKWHGSLAPQGDEKEWALRECGCEDLW